MARIAGVDLPREKRAEIGLTYIYGIGRTSSNKILAAANVNPDTRVRDLTDEEVARIRDVIDEQFTVEGDLRREISPEHQETAGDRMLQRYPSQKRPSGSWSEDKDQRKNQKGSEENCCEQEEIILKERKRAHDSSAFWISGCQTIMKKVG